MQLLIVRHAIAEEREDFARTGQDDSLRPVTAEGEAKMERNAAGLRRALEGQLDLVATSPYVRATQTARIVAAACGGELVKCEPLVPTARPGAFLQWLRERAVGDGALVAAVGHEPHLGALVTWLMTGSMESRVPLRKGGACLLDFAGQPRQGSAALVWALTPSLLRRLGD